MKKTITFLFFLGVFYTLSAQDNLFPILSNVPPIPEQVCLVSADEKMIFKNQISVAQSLLKTEKKRISTENKAIAENYKQQAMNQMAGQYGLTQSDVQKMNQGYKPTEAEKKEMMDKALQSSANLSSDEIKNLKKLDENGKKAWGETYGYEKMAEASIDSTRLKNEHIKNMTMYELVQLQLQLSDTISKMDLALVDRYNQLKADPQALKMLGNIKTWRSQWMNMTPMDDGYDTLKTQIEQEEMQYCTLFSAKYAELLNNHLNQFLLSLPMYYHLEEVTEQIIELQTNIKMDTQKGITALDKLKDYLSYLEDAYKYNLQLQP